MTNKPGRNDPCPCGSGKKYKQCHMLKDQEGSSSAKYTAAGKRKFKAKVIKTGGGDESLNVFGRSASTPQAPVETSSRLERMKFKMTKKDFRVEEPVEPLEFASPEKMPESTMDTSNPKMPDPNVPFKPTKQDFRVDDEK